MNAVEVNALLKHLKDSFLLRIKTKHLKQIKN